MPPKAVIPSDLLRRSGRSRAPVAYESSSSPSRSLPPSDSGDQPPSTPPRKARKSNTAQGSAQVSTTASEKANGAQRRKSNAKASATVSTSQTDFPWDEAAALTSGTKVSSESSRNSSPTKDPLAPSSKQSTPAAKKRKAPAKTAKAQAPKKPRKAKASAKPSDSSPLSSPEALTEEEEPIASSSRVTLDSPSRPSLSSALTPTVRSTLPIDFDDDDDDDDDDLGAALAKAQSKSQNTPRQASRNEDTVTGFRPTTLPLGIEPGSACYVKNLHCFFPAVLLAFEPAQAASEKDRYEVRDMTGYHQFVSRRGIIFPPDKEIATCTLGKLELEFLQPPRASSGPRLPTPELEIAEDADFGSLDWARQLVAIRPHLADIIAEKYGPAQWRIDQFFQSPSARASLRNEIDIGDVREDEQVKEVIPELRRWVSRDPENEAAESGAPSRPPGSARFEALRNSASEFTDYIHTVLLPEALIAITIRSSIDAEDAAEAPTADVTEGADVDASRSPSSSPEPSPEHAAYNAARDSLRSLADNDALTWKVRQTELKAARRRMRQKLKLPPEEDKNGETENEKRMRAERVKEMLLKKEQEKELAFYNSLAKKRAAAAAKS